MTTDITELALLVSKAKASVFTLEYISQFEPADIDSDDVDLRFEVDGRDTGTNVSIVDECGQAAKVIGELVEALEKAQAKNALVAGGIEAAAKLHERIAELESRTVSTAASDVLAERQRQVTAEGWMPGHDDEYEHGELADAAGCYALSSELFDCAGEPPRPWTWPDEWWKPTNRRRDLVKAGALILAEIERLDRAAGIKWEAEK